MTSDYAAWLKQGQRDLDHARHALADSYYEWSCFAARQGAEKAVKALYGKAGEVAWGHSVTALLSSLPAPWRPDETLLDAARELDRHYIPARYPNAHPEGAPYEYYTRDAAERAVAHAEQLISFCANLLAGSTGGAAAAPGSGEDAD